MRGSSDPVHHIYPPFEIFLAPQNFQILTSNNKQSSTGVIYKIQLFYRLPILQFIKDYLQKKLGKYIYVLMVNTLMFYFKKIIWSQNNKQNYLTHKWLGMETTVKQQNFKNTWYNKSQVATTLIIGKPNITQDVNVKN